MLAYVNDSVRAGCNLWLLTMIQFVPDNALHHLIPATHPIVDTRHAVERPDGKPESKFMYLLGDRDLLSQILYSTGKATTALDNVTSSNEDAVQKCS